MTLEEHTDALEKAYTEYLDRMKALAALRAKDGRVLSGTNRNRLSSLVEGLKALDCEIVKLLNSDPCTIDQAALEAFAAHQKTMMRLRS